MYARGDRAQHDGSSMPNHMFGAANGAIVWETPKCSSQKDKSGTRLTERYADTGVNEGRVAGVQGIQHHEDQRRGELGHH